MIYFKMLVKSLAKWYNKISLKQPFCKQGGDFKLFLFKGTSFEGRQLDCLLLVGVV